MSISPTRHAPHHVAGGHLSNVPMYMASPSRCADMVSAAHRNDIAAFSARGGNMSPARNNATSFARSPARVVGTGSKAVMESTTRAAFTPQDPNAVTHPHSGGKSLFAGNASRVPNPGFLAMPNGGTLADKPLSPTSPQLARHKPTRDGPHIAQRPPNAMLCEPLDSHAAAALRIRDPVGYHSYTHQRSWVTQSTVIGEQRAVAPRLPATGDKKEVLQALATVHTAPTLPLPVPTSAPGLVMDQPSTATHRAESMAHSAFRNQWTMPEVPGTSSPGASRDRRCVTTKGVVDTSASVALGEVRNVDGALVSQRPSKVHPTVWQLLQTREQAQRLGDVHSHKRRIVV
jgi:hypothetical protein